MTKANIDLDAYSANYTGYTKVQRLLFIASHSDSLKLQAVKLALEEIKKGVNTALYKEVFENYKSVLNEKPDEEWISKVDQESQMKLEKLELELNSYKTNLIRESIRMGHNDLGDFYFSRGDLQNALKSYLRARDYCTTPKHVIQMSENVITVSIAMGNYALVNQYVSKAESTLGSKEREDKVTSSKLKTAAALSLLDAKKYKQAAHKFIETDIALGDHFNSVISCQDVATYGALCALISFDRRELKQKCIDHAGFKNFLELVPNVRELLISFYESRYTQCLQYLEKIIPEITLDIHLNQHVDTIHKEIRNKALVQYVSPFTSVDLKKMAEVFGTPVNELEQELATLIANKHIKARIDSHNKVLYARVTDQRDTTYQQIKEFGEKYIVETEKHILRMNMLKHRDFVVRPVRKGKMMI